MCVLILICRSKYIHLKRTHQGKNKSNAQGTANIHDTGMLTFNFKANALVALDK